MSANPFTSGKVVGTDYEAELYHVMGSEIQRGHEDFIMSRSELMTFDACPQKWLRGVEDDRDAATEFGSLVDAVVTARRSVKKLYAVYPREYVNKQGEVKPWNNNSDAARTWKLEQGDKTFIKQEVMDKAQLAKARLAEDKRIAALMRASAKQVCVTALYPCKRHKLAVACKALIDLVPKKGEFADCLCDLKTDRNACPRKWQRTVFERDYHVQAALYLDMFNATPAGELGLLPRTRFLHAIVENVPPFEPARRMLSEAFIEVGRARYVAALERYCDCLASKTWPSFDDEGNDLVNGWRLVEPEAWMIL